MVPAGRWASLLVWVPMATTLTPATGSKTAFLHSATQAARGGGGAPLDREDAFAFAFAFAARAARRLSGHPPVEADAAAWETFALPPPRSSTLWPNTRFLFPKDAVGAATCAPAAPAAGDGPLAIVVATGRRGRGQGTAANRTGQETGTAEGVVFAPPCAARVRVLYRPRRERGHATGRVADWV